MGQLPKLMTLLTLIATLTLPLGPLLSQEASNLPPSGFTCQSLKLPNTEPLCLHAVLLSASFLFHSYLSGLSPVAVSSGTAQKVCFQHGQPGQLGYLPMLTWAAASLEISLESLHPQVPSTVRVLNSFVLIRVVRA